MRNCDEPHIQVFMDQNNKCNLTCRMCGFSDPRVKELPKYDMPMELFRKIAEEVFPHAEYLALSCLTEPLMTRDFPRRLDLLGQFNVPFVEVVTNAMLLTETVAHAVIDAPVSRPAVSLDGASAGVYEKIRCGSSFEKVLSNLRTFNRLKSRWGNGHPQLRLNHVLTEFNIREFGAFLQLAESLGVQCIDVRTVIPFHNAAYPGNGDQAFFREVRKCRALLAHWVQKTGVEDVGYLRERPEEIRPEDEAGQELTCRQPWKSLAIHPNGDAQPCITWSRAPLGNFCLQTFEEIWEGEALKQIRREFELRKPGPNCLHCTVRKNEPSDRDDDCFFRMLSKRLPKDCTSH